MSTASSIFCGTVSARIDCLQVLQAASRMSQLRHFAPI
jgi:hypothetical protein